MRLHTPIRVFRLVLVIALVALPAVSAVAAPVGSGGARTAVSADAAPGFLALLWERLGNLWSGDTVGPDADPDGLVTPVGGDPEPSKPAVGASSSAPLRVLLGRPGA